MDALTVVLFIIIGGVAGFVASTMMPGVRLSRPVYGVLGILGAFLGYFLFSLLGVSVSGLFGALFTAIVGALVLLALVGLVTGWRGRVSR